MMNNPSPARGVAAPVVPKARLAELIVIPAPEPAASTMKFSPVRAFFTMSPIVNISADELPAPVRTSTIVPVVPDVTDAILQYLPP
jgi:hypothetical protein